MSQRHLTPSQWGRSGLWWSIVALAVPVAVQMMLQSFLGMADVLMVSELGSVAVAAVGLAAKLHFLLLVLMNGLGAGCGILIAQYSGAKNVSASQKTLVLALVLGSVVMLPFMLLFAYGSDFLLALINPDPQVVALAAEYLQITALALLLTQLIVIYESALRSMGNTALPLAMGALSAVINVILNFALIFGHWGFPELGVAGAAWATLLSRLLQLTGILVWLYAKKHGFALNLSHFLAIRDKAAFKKFVHFSAPLVINHLVWGVGNATYHVLTGFAGTEALAVMGAIVPIESLFFALFVGLSNASTVMIGRSLGAGGNQGAWQLQRLFIQLTITLVIVLGILLWFLRPWVVSQFDQLDPLTSGLLFETLGLFACIVWVKVINMVRILGVLRAGGDIHFVLVTDTIVMWFIGIPCYAFAIFYLEVPFLVIYALMFVEDFAKFIPVHKRISSRKWMRNLAIPVNPKPIIQK